jgi:hypothetical protein
VLSRFAIQFFLGSVIHREAPGDGSAFPFLAGRHTAPGNYELAREHLFTRRSEMDHQTVIHDWYRRLHLEADLVELWLVSTCINNS